jgi:Amidohydrolase family
VRKVCCLSLCTWALLAFTTRTPEATFGGVRQAANENVVAFVGATVVPMTSDRLLTDHVVIVRGDRIAAIGPTAKTSIPQNVQLIDGRGKFLIPGLTDMHSHLPAMTTESREYLNSVLFLFLANGITTVRNTVSLPGHLALREQANRGEIVSPTIYSAGPSIDGDIPHSPADVERLVRQNLAEGWDFFKVLGGITPDDYQALVRTAREVGVAFGGHVPGKVGLSAVLAARQPIIDHLDGYLVDLNAYRERLNDSTLADVASRTKEAGSAVVPTMTIWNNVNGNSSFDTLRSYPELRFMSAQAVAEWTNIFKKVSQATFETPEPVPRIQQRILKALHDRGVTILFGTDSPHVFNVPGFSIHREMRLMREAGLTPYDVLKTATRNPGEYFRAKDWFGTIEVGARADLVLVNGNPLQSLDHLTALLGVMVQGRWIAQREIQRQLNEIATSAPPAGSSVGPHQEGVDHPMRMITTPLDRGASAIAG